MSWFRKHLARLRALEDGPGRISLGMGIGTWIGFLPLLGVKTLLAMGLARLFRGNVVAAVIGVTLHDLLLPLAPLLLSWEYKTGSVLMGSHAPPELPHGIFHGGFGTWLHWSTLLRLEIPLLLGGAVLGIPFGILGYFLCRSFLRTKPPNV